MHCYEVWIKSAEYHGKRPLTYTSVKKLSTGTVVKVDLRHKSTIGIVRREAPAPKGVAMKPIDEILLAGEYTLPPEDVRLIGWMMQYYPSGSGSITQLFLPATWPNAMTDLVANKVAFSPQKLPPLTNEQKKVLGAVRSKAGSFLLHGDTGSGKTRVYTELIQDAINQGRSSLLLVPEIGLTPHLKNQLAKSFNPSIIKIYHSGLTANQRKNVWLEILTSKGPLIVIGPRSALFAPLHNIGLVVVDECHDDGYKQENAPYYHGLRIASQLAHMHDSVAVFGSATPSIIDVFIAKEKEIPILRMISNAKNKQQHTTKTVIVNRKDKTEFTHSSHLSNTLLNAINEQLVLKQQSLLFLNRRGSAKVVACTNCGWRALCPNCELPLTLHEDSFTIRCHTCGYSSTAPTQCPECQNPEIVFYGPGTKALEKELTKRFPDAHIARFDGDNLKKDRLDQHLERIENGDIDIIIGTQVLVKGFDIPKLGLVGVVDADASLSFPDFSTEERTYQLISQAIGRVGRGHVAGTIIVQSLSPDSNLLKQAVNKSWGEFYKNQLKQRKIHHFPPYTFLLKLECPRKRQSSAITATAKLKSTIEAKYPTADVLGPSPAFREKQHGNYTWQLVVKSPRRSHLLEIISNLPSGWKYDIDPTHLL